MTGKRAAPPFVADVDLISMPAFWMGAVAAEMLAQEYEFLRDMLEAARLELALAPTPTPSALATPNVSRLDLPTMTLRDYGDPAAPPTLVVAPYAGHSASIADYHEKQSLIGTLLAHGPAHIALTDWRSASLAMKDFDIDTYLDDLLVSVEDLGGRVNLIGLCQGGWLSAMLAARFPEKVRSLVLVGSPIDTGVGEGVIKRLVQSTPYSYYEDLVSLGGGLMRGTVMRQAWKSIYPSANFRKDQVTLFQGGEGQDDRARMAAFTRWFESAFDLPGRWYLQVIRELFRENRLARGEFVALGRPLDLRRITCPLYLVAGEGDEVAPVEQVFRMAELVGTPKGRIHQLTVPGGHIGLFLGDRVLQEAWPSIARWLVERDVG